MRIDLIAFGAAHDQAVIRFHPRLTVVGGMGPLQRSDFANLLIGAIAGTTSEVNAGRWVDNSGFGIQAVAAGGVWRWTGDDGAPCASPLTMLRLDSVTLGHLMVLTAADLSTVRAASTEGDGPELADARATLTAMDEELADALEVRATTDSLRARLSAVDAQLRSAETDGARRRYVRLLAELERVQVEAASLQGGASVAVADRQFVAAAPDLHARAERWRQAGVTRRAEHQRFGDRERLDPRTLAEALATPTQVPPELDTLAASYEAAEAKRTALEDRLTALAADTLPQPSNPAVLRLAHADQDEVWATARRASEAHDRLEQQSLALGGVEAEGVAPAAAAELAPAHDLVDHAEREVRRRRTAGIGGVGGGLVLAIGGFLVTPALLVVGLVVATGAAAWAIVLPSAALRQRRAQETEALSRAGVASYMTFMLRRVQVNIDPKATEPLEVAALEYRRVQAAWRKLAGEVTVSDALPLEAETRAYAEAITGSHGAADEIAALRHQLTTDAEPAVARGRQALITACAPFGIDDPRLAVDLVRHQATTGSIARQQAALESAEQAEVEAREALLARLGENGFHGDVFSGADPYSSSDPFSGADPLAGGGSSSIGHPFSSAHAAGGQGGTQAPGAPGHSRWSPNADHSPPAAGLGVLPPDDAEVERRIDAFDQARAEAEARDRARCGGRRASEVEGDLARLQALVETEYRPEWAGADPSTDADDPDVDALREERHEMGAQYELAQQSLPDIERLTDRREALERRVAFLSGEHDLPATVPSADLEALLLGRLAAARRVGPHGEAVTVTLNEPFEYVKGDRKWAVLDAVERLSSSVQIVYLTDDVDVLVWARRRAPAGAVSLLEPTPEPVTI